MERYFPFYHQINIVSLRYINSEKYGKYILSNKENTFGVIQKMYFETLYYRHKIEMLMKKIQS